jgi:hypothetical protein
MRPSIQSKFTPNWVVAGHSGHYPMNNFFTVRFKLDKSAGVWVGWIGRAGLKPHLRLYPRREGPLGQNHGPGQDHNLHNFVGGAQDVAGDAAQAALKVEASQPDQGGGNDEEDQARGPQDQER